MRIGKIIAGSLMASSLLLGNLLAQTLKKGTSTDGKYTYTYVEGDPIKARFYTLSNGLTVITSVNKSKPRIQTAVAVKAGSKNDPADNTGLAHYLEHMLFKGTDKYGSLDFAKEKPLLDQIFALYEKYNTEKDENKRREIYREIDKLSNEAAKFAIPNEFDKMCTAIGASGTNAFTSFEQTVYINEIPANEMDRWLMLEAERYRNPQMRLFHTELEAVYEEKNISLDNDGRKVNETMLAAVFKNHPYGTQTTIGTVEHLKNPSLKKIMAYFNQNYVPNNMAVIVAGDLDPEVIVPKIDAAFKYMTTKPVPAFTFKPEEPIKGPVVHTITGPEEERVSIGFRIPGNSHPDILTIRLIEYILSNSTTGLIDLNLNQQQKIIGGGAGPMLLKDYGVFYFMGKPRKDQALEEVTSLLLTELEKVKSGQFDEKMLPAILKNMEIEKIKEAEENQSRFYTLLDAFTTGKDYAKSVSELQDMRKITKDQIIAVAKKYFTKDNYVVVYKKKGPKQDVVKVVKPEITPVALNREDKSAFLQTFMSRAAAPLKPVYLDFNKDIQFGKVKTTPIHAVKNSDNKLFSLYYVLDLGSEHDKKLSLAVNYLEYLGTDKLTADQVKQKFYSLGCSFDVFSSGDQSYVMLTGLDESMEEGIALMEDLLKNAKADNDVWAKLVQDEMKQRNDAKLNKRVIMSGLGAYGRFGDKSPFRDKLSESELSACKADEMVEKIHKLTSYPHKVLYYGPRSVAELQTSLTKLHNIPDAPLAAPQRTTYTWQKQTENKVYFVDYDMVQAELIWLNTNAQYDPSLIPMVTLYNEYFGGSMSSIVFQTIRESKALAYSTYSRFQIPSKKEDPFVNIAYVGTQADKLKDAYDAMTDLLTNMPKAENNFDASKIAVKNSIETERIQKADILFSFEAAMKMGRKDDIRKEIYEKVEVIDFNKMNEFQNKWIKGQPRTLLILGSKKNINMSDLEKYGKVTELSLKDIFGY